MVENAARTNHSEITQDHMRILRTLSVLTCAFALTIPLTATAAREEPAEPTTAAPATITPAVPTTPGRPHASSYNPHAKLDPETQIEIALQHKVEGRPQEAMSTLGLAIMSNPTNARLYAVRGSMLLEQGRIAPALADLEKSIKLAPDDAEALTNRGQAYRQFGRADQAAADLDRAIEIQPDLIAARFNRGAMRYGNRDFKGALEDYDHCVAVDPHLPGPYFNRAMVQDALGDREMAMNDLERFLKIEKDEAFRKQAQEVLELWRNPDKAKALAEEVKPSPHR